jgi:hypothetical protein
LFVLVAWLRGLLINGRKTRAVNLGMAINLAITAAILFLGVARTWPGLTTAAVALSVAILVELLFLYWRARALLDYTVPLFYLGRKHTPATIE